MGAKVHDHIGAKDFVRPQIRSHIRPGRSLLGAVHDFEAVVTHARQGLRQQDHIAQRHTGHGDVVLVAQVVTGRRAKLLADLLTQC